MHRFSMLSEEHAKYCANNPNVFDRRRMRAVRIFWVLCVAYLIEGPLRKWVAPQLAGSLFFLRDPIVILLYTYCFMEGLVAYRKWWKIWFGFALLASAVGLVAFAVRGHEPLGWFFGVRSYWLYVPLAFVLPAIMTRRDVENFVQFHFVLAIPYAALIMFQYRAGPAHWINHSYTGEENLAFVVEDVVRPYGLFTYSFQNVLFVASMLGLTLGWWLQPVRKRKLLVVAVAGTAANMACVLLTGSRTIFFLIAGMVGVSLSAAIVGKRGMRLRGLTIVGGLVAVAGILFVTVFIDAFEHILERQKTASAIEGSTIERALVQATAFVASIDEAPILGEGIGVGTTTVVRILDLPIFIFGENELERVVYELGPIVGLSFVILRGVFASWLVIQGIRAARLGNLKAAPLGALAAILVQSGPITYTTLVGFQAWLVVGLSLCFVRLAGQEMEPRGHFPQGSNRMKGRLARWNGLGRFGDRAPVS